MISDQTRQTDTWEHQQRAARIETLLQEVAAFTDARARATTEELVQTLLDMYGDGLARLLELVAQSSAALGTALIESFARDELVSALLLLHGLHPAAIETRVARALDEVRPYLQSHGGNARLISIVDGVARVRLEGSCHECPASAITLQSVIEEAIYKAAPDLNDLQVEGVANPPPRAPIPVTFVPPRRHREQEPAP